MELPRLRRIAIGTVAVCLALVASPGASAVQVAPPPAPAREAWRVTWNDLSPIPLRKERAVRFGFTTRGAQEGGYVQAIIESAAGFAIASIDTGAEPLDVTGTLRWDGRNATGFRVANGLYRAKLVAVDGDGTRRETPLRTFRIERPERARTIYRVNDAGRRVALTFDDCNFPAAWRGILDVLAKRDVGATFFCLGLDVQRYPDVARRTVRLGHTIGSHSFRHPDLAYVNSATIRDELERTARSWWAVAKVTPAPYLRPPYGDFDAQVLDVAGSLGYGACVLWDVDPSDYRRPGAGVIASRVLANVRPGSIVLLHVLPQTLEALPEILRGLRERNLNPVTLAELLASGQPVSAC
ncbi:MAG: polysaccharide deacetylase family protein [Actinomycetota bacterium]